MNVYSAKSSRFESTDLASVMIDDVGCSVSRGWDVIWRDLFVQIELGVDIASLGIKERENHRVQIFRPL